MADGTHRKHRHGNPGDAVLPEGVPERPDFDNPHAGQLWDDVVGELVSLGIVAEMDTALLRSMCEMWGLYRLAYDVAQSDPIDKDARIAVVAYWGKFEQAASRCGIVPSERARMRIEKPKQRVRQRPG